MNFDSTHKIKPVLADSAFLSSRRYVNSSPQFRTLPLAAGYLSCHHSAAHITFQIGDIAFVWWQSITELSLLVPSLSGSDYLKFRGVKLCRPRMVVVLLYGTYKARQPRTDHKLGTQSWAVFLETVVL